MTDEPKIICDAELESCLLCCALFNDADYLPLILQPENAALFFSDQTRAVFEAMLRLYERSGGVDAVLLRAELKATSGLEKIAGADGTEDEARAYLLGLREYTPSPANTRHYLESLQALRVKREIQVSALRLADDPTLDGAEKCFTSAQKIAHSFSHDNLVSSKATYKAMEDRLDAFREGKMEKVFFATGFTALDAKIGGLHRSEFCIIAGRPSMGKTTFALNIALNITLRGGKVAVFSYETSSDIILAKMESAYSGVDVVGAATGRRGMTPTDDTKRKQMQSKFYGLLDENLFIINAAKDTPMLSDIRKAAAILHAQHGVEIFIVDYIGLIKTRREERRELEISSISSALKSLAVALNVSVIGISQLNRSVEHREGHKPMLSDLRESGSLEQDADMCFLLYRDDYYHAPAYPKTGDERFDSDVEVIVAKQKHGPGGAVPLRFRKHLSLFVDHPFKAGE